MSVPRPKSQLRALRQTMRALKLRPEHAALVAQCEGLAAALDEKPSAAALWREYRPALELLLAAGEATPDDGEATLLRLVSTPVGNAAQTGTAESGSGGGGGVADAGEAADAVAGAGS